MNLRAKITTSLFVAFFAMNIVPAFGQNNEPPPAGAILDLAGGAVNHGTAVTESVSFNAALANTAITFAFREDPAFISFSNVSLVDNTNPSGNLILNGDFSSGTLGTPNATDWTYANVYGAGAGGTVEGTNDCGGGLSTCWFDGAIQAYDAISQTVATNPGDQYTLSFQYSDDGGLNTFMDQSNNGQPGTGGNGVDILAYAQAGLPAPGNVTPEPGSIALLATSLFGLAGARLRRRN